MKKQSRDEGQPERKHLPEGGSSVRLWLMVDVEEDESKCLDLRIFFFFFFPKRNHEADKSQVGH